MIRIHMMICAFVAMVCVVALPAIADGQQRGAAAYRTEAIGATIGSAIGFGTVLLIAKDRDCGEDLGCALGAGVTAVLFATTGSVVGAYIAGRSADTRPSALGAVLGAAAGAAGAIGVDHLITEEAGFNLSDGGRVAVFAIVQGLVTAVGSRLLSRG